MSILVDKITAYVILVSVIVVMSYANSRRSACSIAHLCSLIYNRHNYVSDPGASLCAICEFHGNKTLINFVFIKSI